MSGAGSEELDPSSAGPGIETTEDAAEAAKPSPDSPEPSGPRRGGGRRAGGGGGAAAATPGASPPPARVLRARGTGAGRAGEPEDATCRKRPPGVHGGCGTPTRSRNRSAPVVRPEVKESAAKTASKRNLGTAASPKLPGSREGIGRPLTRASRTTPAAAAACKPEAEMEALTCGEETDGLKGGDDDVADPDEDAAFGDDPDDLNYEPETKTERSTQRAAPRQREVKEEEPEKEEEEENGIKIEESATVAGQGDDGAGSNTDAPRKRGRQQKDDKVPRLPKRRNKPPVQYVRCEMEGCGTVLAHPRYLQHHIKYQHLLKKKYVCDHPSCGRLFRLQKQLLRHAKHHTDQRDYICEYCARAFKSSHNLAVHRMIHTGEKPIQCEICGFTCRQKASLNWHMKKHDAEASYQFSCSICSKRFEKKDSVVAHKAKSHPEVLIAEALAANGGTVISSPASSKEAVPVLAQPDQPSVGLNNQEVVSGTLAPVQQVVHHLTPQSQIDAPQGPFLLPLHHVMQVEHQQQATNLLHHSTATPAHLTNISHPQLIQLSAVPAGNVAPLSTADPQSALLNLSAGTPLASTGTLGSQQAVQWGKETHEDVQLPTGEGELWERVLVGGVRQDVGEVMWEGSGARRKEDEGLEWERGGERQMLLQCAEDQGGSLM